MVSLPIAMAVAIRVLLFLLLSASAEPTASAVAGPAVSAWEKWMDRLITCAVTCLVLAAWRGSGAKEPKDLGAELWEGAREGTPGTRV